MTEEEVRGDDFLSFSQDSYEDGNRSRQFNRYRGNKHNNRQRFGFGYNQQPYNNHNRSQHNRSYRQHSDNSFNGGQQKRAEVNIQDYIHPSMWEDPWEHCRRQKASHDSFVTDTNRPNCPDQKPDARDIQEDNKT